MSTRCVASIPMAIMNFAIFVVNMCYFCGASNNTAYFIIDVSSIICILMTIGIYRDIFDIVRDTFVDSFVAVCKKVRKNYKRPLSLRDIIKKFIVARRFGFTLPPMNDDPDTVTYFYSVGEYDAVKRQQVEDTVEDSMNLFVWLENKLLSDSKRVAAFDAKHETIGTKDIRTLTVFAVKLIAAELVRRSCPPPTKKNVLDAVQPLSYLVLSLASTCVARLGNLIIDVPGADLKVDAIKEELIKLVMLIVIQNRFDVVQASQKEFRGAAPVEGFFDNLIQLINDWNKSGDALDFLTEQMKAAEAAQSKEEGNEGRAFQILYFNDVNFTENTVFITIDSVKEIMKPFVTHLFADENACTGEFDKIFLSLCREDTHLARACSMNKEQLDVLEKEEQAKLAAAKSAEITEASPAAVQNAFENPVVDMFKALHVEVTPGNYFGMPVVRNPLIVSEFNPFEEHWGLAAERINKRRLEAGKSLLIVNEAAANEVKPPDSPVPTQTMPTQTSSAPSTPSRKNIAKEVSFSHLSDSIEGDMEMGSITKKKSPVAATSENSGGKMPSPRELFNYWWTNSFWLRIFRWIRWRQSGSSVAKFLYDWTVWIVLLPVAFIIFGCIYATKLTIAISDGSLFSKKYWATSNETLLALVPLQIRDAITNWNEATFNAIFVNRFGESCVLGFMSWTFFTFTVHTGQPKHDFNKGLIILIYLTIPFYLHIPKNWRSLVDWYPSILPFTFIALGGFICLATHDETLDKSTFLGISAVYNLDFALEQFTVPYIYGAMHACLVIFCVLPLTMCRYTLRRIQKIPHYGDLISRLLGVHDMYYAHRILGYMILMTLLTTICIWWFTAYYACAHDDFAACNAFYPKGNYFDIRGSPWFCKKETLELGDIARGHKTYFRETFFDYDSCAYEEDGNPGAVVFLRELIVILLFLVMFTAEFKYPLMPSFYDFMETVITKESKDQDDFLSASTIKIAKVFKMLFGSARDFWKVYIEPQSFEIFIYTHVGATYIIAIAALFARFEVFYIAGLCWVWYALDRIYVILFCTHTFYFSKRDSELYDGAIKLTLKKRHWFPWRSNAGEIIFLCCPKIGSAWMGWQWHAFSLASSNTPNVEETHDRVELLIQIQRKGSWTDTLKNVLFKSNATKALAFQVRGPFGSSFHGFRENDFIMLIGGGSGAASSLSVLRELVLYRGNVKRVWFIFACRNFSSVQWCWRAINDIIHPADPSLKPRGFIRMSIHVSGKLTKAQESFVQQNGDLRFMFRPGRPDWKKLFRSFGAQSLGAKGIKKTKICACANKAMYADIEHALSEVNDPNLCTEFSSENFE